MRFIISLIGFLFICLPAKAVTVDFNAVSDEGGLEFLYSEQGVVGFASGGVLAHKLGNPGSVHLTDGGTGFASSISFVTSGFFNAVQFDIDGHTEYCANFACTSPEAFNNVKVTGERNGAVVANMLFFSGIGSSTQALNSDFQSIDRLTISVLLPDNYASSTCIFYNPCSFFDLDNLVLEHVEITAVPLPAGLPLYGAGVGILALIARRKQKNQS